MATAGSLALFARVMLGLVLLTLLLQQRRVESQRSPVKWRRLAGRAWLGTSLGIVLVAPWCLWWIEFDVARTALALAFTVLATIFLVRDAVKHAQNYSAPRLQKHIIRVLFMVCLFFVTPAVIPAADHRSHRCRSMLGIRFWS